MQWSRGARLIRYRVTGYRGAACRHGFTLVEVLIALAITGIVLLGARHLVVQTSDTARAITRSARVLDADANAERLVRALAGRLEVGTPEAREFEGAPDAVRFTSWCEVPSGWLERCEVRLGFDSLTPTAPDRARPDDAGASLALTLTMAPRFGRVAEDALNERLVLRAGLRAGTLRYLEDPNAGGVWYLAWGRGISAPLAVAIITTEHLRAGADASRDALTARPETLIVRIGARG